MKYLNTLVEFKGFENTGWKRIVITNIEY